MLFVDGPDGVGKTGYSKWVAENLGLPRLEMRPVDDTDYIEEKSKVFNAAIRDLHDQGVDLVIDRGSVSSIVYSRAFNRPRPDHAWETLIDVGPTIIYLACDPHELGIRYDDELFSTDGIREIAAIYEETMVEVEETTDASVYRVDTTAGAPEQIRDVEMVYTAGEKAVDAE